MGLNEFDTKMKSTPYFEFKIILLPKELLWLVRQLGKRVANLSDIYLSVGIELIIEMLQTNEFYNIPLK